MKIGLAQINTTVGDFEGNFHTMSCVLETSPEDVGLIVFPECCVCGYPQQDLLDFQAFAERAEETSQKLVQKFPQKSFIFGSIERNKGEGKPYYNVAIFADQGKVVAKYQKRLLPTYDVFDEDRFFESGRDTCLVEFKGEKLGVSICEDIWSDETGTALRKRYGHSPLDDYKDASIFVNLSASPFEHQKFISKRAMLQGIAQRHQKPLVYVNAVGANDSIIFDGRSYGWSSQGDALVSAKAFEEDFSVFDTAQEKPSEFIEEKNDPIQNIHQALVIGIRDYCQKVGFSQVVLGLSGGIDSSVIACLAAEALGSQNVLGVLLPSRYTSEASNSDALVLAKNLGIKTYTISIEEMFKCGLSTLGSIFEGTEPGIAEENIQARARGLLLMAISNKFGHLLLTTGNKSELAVGYCTIYGDMCGGLSPLSDLYKTQVYALAKDINKGKELITESVFTKPPTAELRPNQTDQDNLPPYEELDRILKSVLEDFKSFEELENEFDRETLQKVKSLYSRAEYKRYQMPLGLKVSPKAFGIGRRIPLVQKFQ